MKKIILSLIAVMATMSINAQVIKVYKNGNLEKTYTNTATEEYKVVFEVVPEPEPSSVTFTANDFTGSYTGTITASNDDVTVTLTLSDVESSWVINNNIMVIGGEEQAITITATPNVSGVTVTGFVLDTPISGEPISKTGVGPWSITYNNGSFIDGTTPIPGMICQFTVNYTK